MDKDKSNEIITILDLLKPNVKLMKDRLGMPADKRNIDGLKTYALDQIKILKTLASPRVTNKDKEVFAMIDTLTGLLKKCDDQSLTSFIEVCEGIKVELGVQS